MIFAKLWRFPPLVGFARVFNPKFSRLDQCVRSSIDRAILLRSPDNAVQHAGLADFGICFMIGTFTEGWQKTVLLEVKGDDEEGS